MKPCASFLSIHRENYDSTCILPVQVIFFGNYTCVVQQHNKIASIPNISQLNWTLNNEHWHDLAQQTNYFFKVQCSLHTLSSLKKSFMR